MEMLAEDNHRFYPAARDLKCVATPENNLVWTEKHAVGTASPAVGLSDWFNALPGHVSSPPLRQYPMAVIVTATRARMERGAGSAVGIC